MIKIYTAVPGTWVVTYTHHVHKDTSEGSVRGTVYKTFQVSDRPRAEHAIATCQVLYGGLPGFKVKRVEPAMIWQRVSEELVQDEVRKYLPRENERAKADIDAARKGGK